MAKKMKTAAWFFVLLTIFCAMLYGNMKTEAMLAWTITLGTASYHIIMRLLVGFVIDSLFHNHVDYRLRRFQVSAAEQKLYEKLNVKRWKGKLGTYDPDCFDCQIHSWDEIAQATCQAELVHEWIIVFSFVPIFAAIWFGEWPVFVITSFFAACVDAMFVMIQRYNRPRILKLIEKSERNNAQ